MNGRHLLDSPGNSLLNVRQRLREIEKAFSILQQAELRSKNTYFLSAAAKQEEVFIFYLLSGFLFAINLIALYDKKMGQDARDWYNKYNHCRESHRYSNEEQCNPLFEAGWERDQSKWLPSSSPPFDGNFILYITTIYSIIFLLAAIFNQFSRSQILSHEKRYDFWFNDSEKRELNLILQKLNLGSIANYYARYQLTYELTEIRDDLLIKETLLLGQVKPSSFIYSFFQKGQGAAISMLQEHILPRVSHQHK